MATKKTKKEDPEFDYITIKSFEDACKKEGINPESLPEGSMIPAQFRKAIIAAYKLFIIFKAINNGWAPDWSNWNQYKYFPWFEVKASKAQSSGFGFSDTDCGYTSAHTKVGSRLCTDIRDKALYIARAFQEEYKEFLLINE